MTNPTPTSGAADLPEALHRVIDAFERRERGIPQAHIAAALVTELRAALTAQAISVEPAGACAAELRRLHAELETLPVGYINRGIAPHTKGKTVFHEKPTTNLEARWWSRDEPVFLASHGQAPAQTADFTTLGAAMRAIQQAIGLIGAPTDERMRAVRRVLRGAVIVAEDAGKVAPLPGTAYAALPEPLEIDWPELHSQALGCGVEDRDLHNRYECAEYGWQDGVDKCAERVPEQIFDAAQMLAFADATCALRASHGQAPATQQAGERVYAFRRKGLADFCTCDEARYEELSNKPHLFETRIFYTAPQPALLPRMAPRGDCAVCTLGIGGVCYCGPQPTTPAGKPASDLDDAFECARFALRHCPDNASVGHILGVLRAQVAAPQPSPTAQAAESVPAGPKRKDMLWATAKMQERHDQRIENIVSGLERIKQEHAGQKPQKIDECYGDCPTDPTTCTNPCRFDGRAARAPADSVLEDAASAGFFLQLPQRPKPEAPAGTVGLDWDAYSGAQMLAYGRDCSNAAIVATQKPGGA